jgi:hypothetical protein
MLRARTAARYAFAFSGQCDLRMQMQPQHTLLYLSTSVPCAVPCAAGVWNDGDDDTKGWCKAQIGHGYEAPANAPDKDALLGGTDYFTVTDVEVWTATPPKMTLQTGERVDKQKS